MSVAGDENSVDADYRIAFPLRSATCSGELPTAADAHIDPEGSRVLAARVPYPTNH